MRIDDRHAFDLDLDLERASPTPTPTPPSPARSATRAALVTSALPDREPPERLAFYAGLRAQVASPTATDATTASSDQLAKRGLDDLRDAYSGPYTVGDLRVVARPMFRLNQGVNEKAMQSHKGEIDALAKRAGVNGPSLRNGCAAPRDLVKVTQALIDAGKLPSGPGDASSRIRQMQWRYGIGVDCAAYTRRGFLAANHLSEAKTASLDVKALGTEAFRELDSNRHFEKVGPADVRSGDIVTLDATPPGRWGHNVVVHGNTVANDAAKAAYAAQHGAAAKAFLQGPGPYHVIQVDSSWGAGASGADYGGYRRDTWLYDASTKEWGYLEPSTKAFNVSKTGPASDDGYHGAYRLKGNR